MSETLAYHALHPLREGDTKTDQDRELFGGHRGYRSLGCFMGNTLVQIDPQLRDNVLHTRKQFEAAGIELLDDKHIIFSDDPTLARYFDETSYYEYNWVVHEALGPERGDADRLEATKNMNNKNWFMEFCSQNGISIPGFVAMEGGQKPNEATIASLGYPMFVKAVASANGRGIIEVRNDSELASAISEMGSREYQLQQKVPNVFKSLSTQYHAKNGIAEHIVTTEQLVNPNNSHAGNVHYASLPPTLDPTEMTDRLAGLVAKAGIEGVYGFDLVVDGKGNFYVIECNARYTGATYPTLIAARAGLASMDWAALKVPTEFDKPGDLWLPKSLQNNISEGIGVIVVNNATAASHGEVDVIIAGTPEDRSKLLMETIRRFNPSRRDGFADEDKLALVA